MRRSRPVCRVLASLAALLATLSVAPTASTPTAAAGIPARDLAPAPAARSAIPVAITPEVTAPRVAYTEDTTELVVREVFAEGGAPDRIIAGAGQGSSSPDLGNLAYVGTKDQDQGEVYFRPSLTDPAELRVTCDASVQTHPVVSPDGRFVAYASNETGSFQIWVTQVDNGPGTWDCTNLPRVQLTHSSGDNLWPAWAGGQRLVFSSTRADPLGDIFVMPFAGIGIPASDAAAQRLTDGPAAETQPTTAVLPDSATGVSFLAVVFTTTAFRTDGSLAWLRMPNSTDPGPFPVASVWGSAPAPQGERASFLTPGGTARLAFTSTQADPYGDVRVVMVDPDQPGTVTVLPTPDDGVAAEPGRAESDPAWARVVVRDVSEFTYVVFTRHTQSADIADVVAADGSGRRVIASATLGSGDAAGPSDEGTPAYSPDGLRIAYSRGTRDDLARELVTCAADGSDVRVLVPSRAEFDIDIQPVWSPDGTQIAFVRYPFVPNVEQWGPSEIWVVTVATGTTRRLSLSAPVRHEYWDEHPSWSSDGRRLVIARADITFPPDLAVTLAPAGPMFTGVAGVVNATVTNVGRGATNPRVASVTFRSRAGEGPAFFRLAATDPRCTRPGDGSVVCELGLMAPGASVTVAFGATPSIAGTGLGIDAAVDDAGETNLANNTATTLIDVTTPPDLRIQTSFPSGIFSGSPFGLTLDVFNDGPMTAQGVVVAVDLTGPAHVNPTQNAGCARVSDTAARCMIGTRTQTGTVPSEVVLSVVPDAAGTLTYTATVSSTTPDSNVDNNTETRSIVIIAPLRDVVPPAFVAAPHPVSAVVPAAFLATDAAAPARSAAARNAVPADSPPISAVLGNIRPVPEGIPDASATQLWVLDVTTGDAVQLFAPAQSCPPTRVCNPVPLTGRQPAWAPDGPRVAFENQGMVFVATLLDANADGVADLPEQVVGIAAVTGFANATTPTPNRPVLSAATDPAWSPDASELAVAGQPAGQPDMWGIYALKPDGTGLRVIAQRIGNPETEPAWQPYADLTVTLAAVPPTIATGATTTLTATVRNNGPAGAAAVRLRVELPAGMTPGAAPAGCALAAPLLTCPVGLLTKGASASSAIALHGTTAGTFVGTAVGDSPTPDPRPIDNTATASVVVVQPVLRIDPNVVVPGQVTMASGSNFPPGAQVTLTWDTGLTEPRPPVTVQPDGTIAPTQILIFRRDPLGNRQLVATSVVPGVFDPVTAGGLVAPPPQEPPDFVERR